jgi:hypothetical protein
MLEKLKHTLLEAPTVIAVAMIAGEDGSGCSANLLG